MLKSDTKNDGGRKTAVTEASVFITALSSPVVMKMQFDILSLGQHRPHHGNCSHDGLQCVSEISNRAVYLEGDRGIAYLNDLPSYGSTW